MVRKSRGGRVARLARSTALAAPMAAAGLSAPAPGQDLPTGGHTDCADIFATDNAMQLLQLTPECVIDWETFNIGAGFLVDFQQQSSWRVLNRVNGAQFSMIAGRLTADGTVYIVNPAGIYFAGSALVDVGGIYAAAASMSDADFMAGIDRFTGLDGEVVNQGMLTGQAIHLIGRRVVNEGMIAANGGAVTLLAGEDEVLIGEQGGRIMVRIDGVDLTDDLSVSPGGVPPTLTGTAGVENSGTITAADGQVVLGAGDLYSLAIRNTGTIGAQGGSAQLAATGGTVVHGGALAAGEVSMTGDVLFLDADVAADAARFNDPAVIGSDVLIGGAAVGAEADSVLFNSTVDSEDGESNDLAVNAAQTTFGADVGGDERLGRLDVSGEAELGGDLRTTGGLHLDGDATLTGAGNQTIDAGAGALTGGADITKVSGGAMNLRGGTVIDVEGSVSVENAGGNLGLTAPTIEVGGGVASTGGRVTFSGHADVAGSVTAGTDTRFEGDAIVGGAVTAGDDALFFGAADVGGGVTASDEAQFFGAATVGGDVSAGDDVLFLDAAEVGGSVSAFDDLTFAAGATVGGDVSAGDDAVFAGPSDIGGSASAGDDLEFQGAARIGGDATAADDVTFLAEATVGGSVSAGDDAEFTGVASVGGDVTVGGDAEFFSAAAIGGDVTAGDDVEFLDTAAVGGSVSAVDDAEFTGAASVGGDVTSGIGDVTFFDRATVGGDVSAGRDAEFFGVADVRGDVSAADDVEFMAPATVGGDIAANDAVRIDSTLTLDGAGDQRVEAGGNLRTKGALVKATGGRLTLVAGEQIVLNGGLVQAIGDILLNPQGAAGIPAIATITANEDLTIVSLNGLFLMGPAQKLTAIGDLVIRAAVRATLGDLNSAGDMVVDAPEILLRTRAAGLVLTVDGRLVADEGLDFVAGGRFFFSVAPTLEGDGTVRFGSGVADADALGTLGGFRLRVVFPLFFKRGDTILDLVAQGPTTTQLAEVLGGRPTEPVPPPAGEPVLLSPAEADALARLGIEARPLTAAEQAAGLAGRYLYDDAPEPDGDPDTGRRRVASRRLGRDAVRKAIERLEVLAAPAARDVLETAWEAYAATTEAPNGAGFRRFLEAAPDGAPALAVLRSLRGILDNLGRSGLSTVELRAARQSVLEPYTSPAMGAGHLEAAVGR